MLAQSLWSFFLVLLLIGCATEQESSMVEVSHPPVSQADVDSIRDATIQDIVDSIVATSPEESEPLEDLYERACEGVYLIYAFRDDGSFSQGTCFLIASSGLMVTNHHVVVDGIYFVVIDRYGREFAIDTFLTYSDENDFAVFQLAQPFQGGTVLSIAKELPRIGEASFAIGNPLGLTQTLSTGIISGFRDNTNIIQTTAEFTFGSSGGPLFNRRGEVIGITTAIKGDANLNFAMNIRLVPLSDLIGIQEDPLDAGGGTTPARTRVKAALENYFAAKMDGDLAALRTFYAPRVSKHFNSFALTAVSAANADNIRRWAGPVIPLAFEPQWDYLELTALQDGMSLDLPVIFKGISRTTDEAIEEEKLYRIEMDREYKIRLIELVVAE